MKEVAMLEEVWLTVKGKINKRLRRYGSLIRLINSHSKDGTNNIKDAFSRD